MKSFKLLLNFSLLFIICLFFSGCGPGVQDYKVKLDKDYRLGRSSANAIIITNSDEVLVEEKVTKVAVTDKYILAKRCPVIYEGTRLTKQTVDEEHPDYWVIEIESAKVYGPLKIEEFDEIKSRFNIPASVKLIPSREYAEGKPSE